MVMVDLPMLPGNLFRNDASLRLGQKGPTSNRRCAAWPLENDGMLAALWNDGVSRNDDDLSSAVQSGLESNRKCVFEVEDIGLPDDTAKGGACMAKTWQTLRHFFL